MLEQYYPPNAGPYPAQPGPYPPQGYVPSPYPQAGMPGYPMMQPGQPMMMQPGQPMMMQPGQPMMMPYYPQQQAPPPQPVSTGSVVHSAVYSDACSACGPWVLG